MNKHTFRTQTQSGRSLLVIMIVIVFLMAGGIVMFERSKAKRNPQLAAEVQAVVQAKQEAVQQVKQETAAVSQRANAKSQSDAYTAALATIDGLLRRWSDAEQIAGATSRISLSGPVASLQAIKREAEALIYPPCLDTAKADLAMSMDLTLEGYLLFMANRGEIGTLAAGAKLSDAKLPMSSFKDKRAACPSAPPQ